MLRVTSMKKQKTSKQISDNYEANFSAVPDDVDYDEYILELSINGKTSKIY